MQSVHTYGSSDANVQFLQADCKLQECNAKSRNDNGTPVKTGPNVSSSVNDNYTPKEGGTCVGPGLNDDGAQISLDLEAKRSMADNIRNIGTPVNGDLNVGIPVNGINTPEKGGTRADPTSSYYDIHMPAKIMPKNEKPRQ